MTAIHLHTPAAPRVAMCGDVEATRFATWRWQVTCQMCKLASAARPMDAVTEQPITYRKDIPIRYTRLVAFFRARSPLPNVEASLAEFERERKIAARCPKCGELADPIALYDVPNNRIAFVCPDCCGNDGLRARWEKEGA